MTLQVVASPRIIILMTLGVSFMLLENIYSTGVTYDRHLWSSKYFYITGHSGLYYKQVKIVIYDRNDSGQYYKTTITIIIDDPSLS